jgi:hypothetical protein
MFPEWIASRNSFFVKGPIALPFLECKSRISNVVQFGSRSYHFVIALWRLKAAQFDQREVLGSHR